MAKKYKLMKNGETIYPCSITDAIVNPNTRKTVTEELTELENKQGIYNVDANVPLSSGQFYTASTARNAVPTSVRKLGLIITYKTDAATSVTEQFIGSSISAWTTESNWKNVGAEGGNLILEWDTDVATTRKQVKQANRRPGMQISYNDSENGWTNEQFLGNDTSDFYWVSDKAWIKISENEIKNNIISKYFIKSEELNEENLTINGILNATGAVTTGNWGFVTDYIEGNAYTDYSGNFINFEGQGKPTSDDYFNIACFYDKNYTFLKASIYRNDFDENAAYIRFYCDTQDKQSFSVKVGRLTTLADNMLYNEMLPFIFNYETEETISFTEKISNAYINSERKITTGSAGYDVYYKYCEEISSFRIIQPDGFLASIIKKCVVGIFEKQPKINDFAINAIQWAASDINLITVPKGAYLCLNSENGVMPTVELINFTKNKPSELDSYKDISSKRKIIENEYVNVNSKTISSFIGTKRTEPIYIGGVIKTIKWVGDTDVYLNQIATIAYLDENLDIFYATQERKVYNDVPEGAMYVILSFPSSAEFPHIESILSEYVQATQVAQEEKYNDIYMPLPSYVDVVKGRNPVIYIDGLFSEPDSNLLMYYITSDDSIATVYNNRVVSINSNFTGEKTAILSKREENLNTILVSKDFNIRAIEKNGDGSKKAILIIGDSLIASGYAANEVYTLLAEDGDFEIEEIGTITSANAKHEGRGSWTWSQYLKDGSFAGSTNAFYINGKLDFKSYLQNNFPEVNTIDAVIISLGTNDISQNPNIDNIKNLQTIIAGVIENAKTFLNALLDEETGFPNTKIAIGLIGFGAANQIDHIRERSLKVAYSMLNQAYIDNFDNGKYSPNVTTVLHGAYIDRYYSYGNNEYVLDNLSPSNTVTAPKDVIHPQENGYRQWGRGYYAKIRAFLAGYL